MIKTKLGNGWTHWGLLDYLEYDLPREGGSSGTGGGTPEYPGDNTGPKPGDNPYPANLPPLVGPGSSGSVVKVLQLKLNNKGANPVLATDGIFGLITAAAVLTYQRANGLTVDGIVGPQTWTKLLETVPTDSIPPQVSYGSRGDTVKKLQMALNAKGASPRLDVDGIFGQDTIMAVYAYQKANSLVPDGIVGPKTWAELLK